MRPGAAGAGAVSGLWLKWDRAGVSTRALLDKPLRIGRDRTCDIWLDEPTVSRHHAVVSIVNGRVHIDASTSANGIRLDEGHTTKAMLDVGQSFKIGNTTFSIVERPILTQPVAPTAPAPALAPGAQPAFGGLGMPYAALPAYPPGFAAANATGQPRGQSRRLWPFAVVGAIALVAVIALGGLFWYVGGQGQSSALDSSDGAGVTPRVEQVDSSWVAAPAVTDGLSVRYPEDWHVDQPATNQIILRQPDSPADRPVPTITFSFEAGVQATEPAQTDGMSAPQPIAVAGLQGWEYHQTGFVAPSAATFIDLPYHGGRLRITATRGPAVNLVPQLEEILKTMQVGQ